MYSYNLTECLRNFFSYWFSWLHRLINIHLHETLTPEIESIFNVKGLRLKFSVNHLKWNTIFSLWPNSSTEIISWISIQEQSNTINTSVSSTWVSIQHITFTGYLSACNDYTFLSERRLRQESLSQSLSSNWIVQPLGCERSGRFLFYQISKMKWSMLGTHSLRVSFLILITTAYQIDAVSVQFFSLFNPKKLSRVNEKQSIGSRSSTVLFLLFSRLCSQTFWFWQISTIQ